LKVAVHVEPHHDRTCNRDFPTITDCSDIVSATLTGDVDFFPVFYGFEQYLGMEYGVDWPGTYSCAFTHCSFSALGDIQWPAGSVPQGDWIDGITHGYAECVHSPIAIPGWGWIYEPGPATIRVVPHPIAHYIGVDLCSDGLNGHVGCSFAAGIGGAEGEQPCGPSLTQPSTWGHIKALFE
jgi:hypothetical protein